MNSVPWGGSEVLWHDTANILAKHGHNLALATPYWKDLPDPIAKAINEWGAHHSFVLSKKKSLFQRTKNKLLRIQSLNFHRNWLRRHRPRLLCISNGNAFQGLVWMEAAIAENVPFITIAQAHADFLSPDDSEAIKLIEAFSAAKLNYFVSKANQEMVESQLGWRFGNARLIANHSFHLSTKDPLPWPNTPEQHLRLACVARLHPASKGQDILFNVLASPRWQERELSISLYGTGDQEQCLRRLASLLGISDRVQFMGHTNTPESIWGSHHALILPSRYEGMPLVMMEAMLAGRPVITTAVAGAPELISHGVNGFLAEAATIEHLQLCLEEAWQQRFNWCAIGQTAHIDAAARGKVPPAEQLASEMLELVQ